MSSSSLLTGKSMSSLFDGQVPGFLSSNSLKRENSQAISPIISKAQSISKVFNTLQSNDDSLQSDSFLKQIKSEDNKYGNLDSVPAILRGDFVYTNMRSLGEKKSVQDIEKWLDSTSYKIINDASLQPDNKKSAYRQTIIKAFEGLMVFVNRDHDLIAKLLKKILNMIYEFEETFSKEALKTSINSSQLVQRKEKDTLTTEISTLKTRNENLLLAQKDLEAQILKLTQKLSSSNQKIEQTHGDKDGKEKVRNNAKPDHSKQIHQTPIIDFKQDEGNQFKSNLNAVKTIEKVDKVCQTEDQALTNIILEDPKKKSSINNTEKFMRSMTARNFTIKLDDNGITECDALSPLKPKKALNQDAFSGRSKTKMQTVAYSDLKQASKGQITLTMMVKKYDGEMGKFYTELKKIINNLELIPEVLKQFNIEHLRASIDKNQEYNKSFFNLVFERDSEHNEEVLNLKIEMAEKAQLLFEYDQSSNNWKKRFDKFFQQYQRLKEFTTLDQENREKMIVNYIASNNPSKDIQSFLERIKDSSVENLPRPRNQRGSILSVAPLILSIKNKKFHCLKNVSGTLAEIMKEFFIKGTLLIDNPFSFHNKKKVLRNIFTVNFNEAQRFMRDIKEIPVKPNEEMKVDQILKVMSGVYALLMKQNERKDNDNPLYFFVYDYFMNNYAGLIHIVDKKVRALISSSLTYVDTCPKIRVFLRLMTLIHHDAYEFDGRDLNAYITLMREVDVESSKDKGMALASNIQEQTVIPLQNAIETGLGFLNQSEEINAFSDLHIFEKELNENKLQTISNKGKPLIDFDIFFEKCMFQKYNYYKSRLELLFKAFDVHLQGDLGVEQFLFIVTAFEPNRFTYRGMLSLFSKYVDLIDEDSSKNFISFRQFAICVEEEKILKPETIENFIKNTHDQIKDLETLETEWTLRKNLIRLKLIKSRCYNILYQKMLTSIDEVFPIDPNDDDLELIWLRYRLLDFHSNYLYMDLIVSGMIPHQFEEISIMNKKIMD